WPRLIPELWPFSFISLIQQRITSISSIGAFKLQRHLKCKSLTYTQIHPNINKRCPIYNNHD
ncbi:MAG: hypothetical protein ACI9S6_003050, partial [Reinekea sp.]